MERARLFNLRLFAVIFASLVLGIAFSVSLVAGIVFFFILLAITLLLFVKSHKVCYIAVILLAYLVGFFYASGLNWYNEAQIDYPENGYIIGRVTTDTPHDVNGLVSGVVVLDDIVYNDEEIDGKASLFLSKKSYTGKLKVGDTISVRGSMMREGIDTSSLGGPKPYIEGIRYTINATSLDRRDAGDLNFRDRCVAYVSQVLYESVDADTAGFLTGMMFGETGLITEGIKSASRRLGIAHLFAVSGLHVGMIVGFAMLILSRTKLNTKWYLLILPFLYFYAYMCDFSVSVVRATIMVTILLISRAIYMRYDMLSSLGFAGSVILLINPYYLFDVSFVMSFLAVLAIALFSDPIYDAFTRKSMRFKGAKRVLAANISVNIGLLPIMLHLFGGVSLLTIPVNFVLIPIISAIFPAFFLLTIFVIIVHLDVLVPWIALPFVLIVSASRSIASLNFLGINFSVSWYFVVAYVIVMILVSRYVFLGRRLKMVPKVALVAVLAIALVVPSIERGIYGGSVEVIDAYDSYAVTYEDDESRRVLVLMGDMDKHLYARAVDMLARNNIGKVDIIIVPSMTYDDVDMVSSIGRSLRADTIVTHEEYVFDGVDNVNEYEEVTLYGDGNVLIETDGVRTMLTLPRNSYVPYGNYDVVIAHNRGVKEENFTSKHYKNFAQSSHEERSTGFTFCTKNGKITLYNEI